MRCLGDNRSQYGKGVAVISWCQAGTASQSHPDCHNLGPDLVHISLEAEAGLWVQVANVENLRKIFQNI